MIFWFCQHACKLPISPYTTKWILGILMVLFYKKKKIRKYNIMWKKSNKAKKFMYWNITRHMQPQQKWVNQVIVTLMIRFHGGVWLHMDILYVWNNKKGDDNVMLAALDSQHSWNEKTNMNICLHLKGSDIKSKPLFWKWYSNTLCSNALKIVPSVVLFISFGLSYHTSQQCMGSSSCLHLLLSKRKIGTEQKKRFKHNNVSWTWHW